MIHIFAQLLSALICIDLALFFMLVIKNSSHNTSNENDRLQGSKKSTVYGKRKTEMK